MPFKRVHFRADFHSNLSTTEINDFIDDLYSYCSKRSLTGLLMEIDRVATFIYEGDANKVDEVTTYLDGSSELVNGDGYYIESDGPVYSCLASHVTGDARDDTC